MIVIVGESASGKSTVAQQLVEHYDFKQIITYTTRPPRKGEKDGIDYHFVTDEEFAKLKAEGFFAETAKYNEWSYGSAKKDYKMDTVAVLTPRGLRSIIKNGTKNVFSVYLNVPRRDRLIKCLERGDNIEEAYRRNLSDVGQFDGIKDEVDLIVGNPKYTMPAEAIANLIMFDYKW